MKVLAVAGDIEASIAEIRLRVPLQALAASDGFEVRFRSLHGCLREDLAWADVLVTQRGASRRALRLQQRMRRSAGRVVYEIDDLLTRPAPHLVQHADSMRRAQWVERCIAAADAVSVSTERLAAALGVPIQRLAIIPNYAFGDAPRAPQSQTPVPATLVLASSDRLLGDFVVAAVREVAARNPGRLEAVCIGLTGLALTGLPVRQHGLLTRQQFVALLATLANPIALMPLGATAFDACKSVIKFFDYAVVGVPVICSDVPPYADGVRHGVTGLRVANTVAAWGRALQELLDDPQRARALAAAARAEVLQRHALEHTVRAWRELLLSLGPRVNAAPAPGAWERLVERVERVVQGLREANRKRLRRRQKG